MTVTTGEGPSNGLFCFHSVDFSDTWRNASTSRCFCTERHIAQCKCVPTVLKPFHLLLQNENLDVALSPKLSGT